MADITNQRVLDKLKVLDTLKDDVRIIVREEVADIRDEQLRQGALLEDMEDKIVGALESKSKLIISTVRDHSAQIKQLQANQN